jgi:ribosome maturation factor RimP
VLVRIDRLDEAAVSVEDVELASEVFALELDRLDPIETAFLLEVESPGAERPLRTARHFERFHDLLAKVRSNGETFTGRIRGVADDVVSFETPGGERNIPLAAIDGAWLAEWPDSPR